MSKGLISYLLILFSLLAIIIVGLHHLFAIDKTVTSGSAYGLTIGTTKLEAYKYIVEHELSNSYGYIQGGGKAGKINVFTIKQSSYSYLKQYHKWRIIYGKNIAFDNILEIVFNDEKIISITRQRQVENITPYITEVEKLFTKIFRYFS